MRMFSMLFLGLAALPAQQQSSPFQCVPKDAMLVMTCAGPAQWRSMFGDAQVARLFRGPVLGKLVDEANKGLDMLVEQAKDAPFDVAALRQGIENYSGQMVFAVNVDLASLPAAMENDEPPSWSLAMVLSADGHSDLAGMVEGANKLIESSGEKLIDLKVGGQQLRVMDNQREHVQASAPALIGGNIVMLMGSDLQKQAASFLDASKPRFDGSSMQQSAFGLHLEAAAGMKTLIDAFTKQGEAQGLPFDLGAMFGDLGLGALQNMSLRIGADGKHVVADVDVGLLPKKRGLFDVYGQPSAMRPKLLDYVPAAAESFTAMQLDLNAIYRTAAGIWDGMAGVVPVSREDMEKQFAEACKVRLKEDLLDLIGGEFLAIGDPEAQANALADEAQGPAAALAMLAGSCYGLQLQDGVKFAASIDKVLRANGLHAAQKTEDYQGTKVNRLSLGILEIEYAITPDMLLVALGSDESSRKNLRAVLDEESARRSGKAPAELAAGIKSRLAAMPNGWCGLSVQSMSQMTSTILYVLEKAGEEQDLDPEMLKPVREVLTALPGELRKLGLEQSVSTTYVTDRGFTSHMRW